MQHGSPEPPHSVHVGVPVSFEHTVPVSVQAWFGQHGSPSLPHVEQKPSEAHTWSIPSLVHDSPVATHVELVPPESQQPVVQESPAQHGSPGPPQATHAVPLQTVFAVLHDSPVYVHVLFVESQQPPVQGVPVVQHAPPA